MTSSTMTALSTLTAQSALEPPKATMAHGTLRWCWRLCRQSRQRWDHCRRNRNAGGHNKHGIWTCVREDWGRRWSSRRHRNCSPWADCRQSRQQLDHCGRKRSTGAHNNQQQYRHGEICWERRKEGKCSIQRRAGITLDVDHDVAGKRWAIRT